jgi:hypothetical protein
MRKPLSPPPYNDAIINTREKGCLLSDGEKTQLKKRIYRSLDRNTVIDRKTVTNSRH